MKTNGIIINNIFTGDNETINLTGDSKIYNNYIDYTKIEDNGNNAIKKNNLQPASAGNIYLATDNKTLTSNSPVIDKGLNPSSTSFKDLIGGATRVYNDQTQENDIVYPKYEEILELLKTDLVGNKRIHNNTIDMGAVEFGSSK